MKIFISADIEGTTGIAHWSETEKSEKDYQYFQEQMNREVRAACEGAVESGANEIWIKDAHDSGRNIEPNKMPRNVDLKIIRGWSGHPLSMIQELNETFDAIIFTGYHSWGGSDGNPLAHTMNTSSVNMIKINGEYCSEFMLHGYGAAYLRVPVAFLSGDKELCREVNRINENIVTVGVNEGVGNSSISIHPDMAVELIKKGVSKSLKKDLSKNIIQLPDKFKLEVDYTTHGKAYKSSFYPGARLVSPKKVVFETEDYFEIMRAAMFIL